MTTTVTVTVTGFENYKKSKQNICGRCATTRQFARSKKIKCVIPMRRGLIHFDKHVWIW